MKNRTKLLSVEMGDEIMSFLSSEEGDPRAVLRFGHAETVMPLFVFFGLFRDTMPLLHSTPEKEWKVRKWNTSRICPFQANIAFFVAECAGKESIVIQVNEQTVSIIAKDDFTNQLRIAKKDRTCEVDKSIHGTIFGC